MNLGKINSERLLSIEEGYIFYRLHWDTSVCLAIIFFPSFILLRGLEIPETP